MLQELSVWGCLGITSLQPVADMNVGLASLWVEQCRNVQEDVLELPKIQSTARVKVVRSNIKKVVVTGGVQGGITVEV